MNKPKPLRRWGELAFLMGTVLMAVGVSLMEKGGLGMSMVAAQPYILSLGIPGLSFGTADYLIQGLLLAGCFLLEGRFLPLYFLSFLSAFLFGVTLDGVIRLIGGLTAGTPAARWLMFLMGMQVCTLGVAMFFKTYLPLQVYELFVAGLGRRFRMPLARAKTLFDCCCCASAVILSFAFFGELKAVGPGTVLCALFNGSLVGCYGRALDKFIDFSPALPGLRRMLKGSGAAEGD